MSYTHPTGSGLLRKYYEQDGLCLYSGLQLDETNVEADHIVGISDEGTNSLENLALIHKDVNRMKGSMDLTHFVKLVRLINATLTDDLVDKLVSRASGM